MVGALQYLSKDPNNKGRGAGVYYHRGKNYYAKYTRGLDKKRTAKLVNVRNTKARRWFKKHLNQADAGTRDNL